MSAKADADVLAEALQALTRIAATRDQQCMFGLGTALRCPRPGAWQFDTRAVAPLGALPDAAILNLRSFAQRQLDLAQDGLDALDHLANHNGALKRWVDQAGGAGNSPELIALMARIGGRLQQMPGSRPLMAELAARRRASDRR